MDSEMVGVGSAIKKKKIGIAFLNWVGSYGCWQQIEGKNVVSVEQNVTQFVFITSTFKLKYAE